MADETTESIETAADDATEAPAEAESAETAPVAETEATTDPTEATEPAEALDTSAEAAEPVAEPAEATSEATEAPGEPESAPTVAAPAEAADTAPTESVEPPADAFGTVLQEAPALAPGEPLPVAVANFPADGVERETVLAGDAAPAPAPVPAAAQVRAEALFLDPSYGDVSAATVAPVAASTAPGSTVVTTAPAADGGVQSAALTVSDLAHDLAAHLHTLAPDAADVAVEFVAADEGQPGKGLIRVSAKEQSVAAFVVDMLTHNMPAGWVATPAGTAPDNVNQRRVIYLRCEHDSAD